MFRYLLSALAAAGSASAACSWSATSTLQNSGDASALSSCSTVSGSIAIATGTSDNIALDGIQKLDGDLVINNASQLTTLTGSTLNTITGTWSMNDVQILSTVNFPKLQYVMNIVWAGLPNLQQLQFDATITNASRIDIQNTQLQSLDGIDLQAVDNFLAANNGYLTKVSMQLTSISEALEVSANSQKLQASFPNLEWAYNITFRNVSSVSVPSLEAVNTSMGFFSDYMDTLAAPNLTSVGGTLIIVNNEQLSNITMPELTTVGGGFNIGSNPELKSIDGFPKLKTVGGALDFNGNFTQVDLPALADVKGAFNMQSSGSLNCSAFNGLSGSNNVIKGKYQCAGSQSNPGGANTTPTSSGSSSTSSKGAAAAGYDVSNAHVLATFTGVIAAMLGLW